MQHDERSLYHPGSVQVHRRNVERIKLDQMAQTDITYYGPIDKYIQMCLYVCIAIIISYNVTIFSTKEPALISACGDNTIPPPHFVITMPNGTQGI